MNLITIAQEVLDFVSAEGIELPEDLNQAETVLREQAMRIGACALELHLTGKKLGYEGSSRPCSCGGEQKFVNHRPRTLATLLGQVSYKRAYYHCPQCGASAVPYDQAVGLGSAQQSVGLAKATCELGVDESFKSAARKLYDLTGVRLGERTVGRRVRQAGKAASAQEERLAGQMESWQSPQAQDTPNRHYTFVDGTMGHLIDGWHEIKACACSWEDANGTRHARYVARLEEAEAFVPFVWSLACRCGWEQADEKILLGDGARWIWDRVGGVLDDCVHEVDWYHAMEHVWTCGKVLHGEGSAPTVCWVKHHEALLWEGQWRRILAELAGELKRWRAASKRLAIQSLMTYLENQGERLAYNQFRQKGFKIGSGEVESACKHVVGLRIKRGGMRWSREGMQAVLSLRSAWKSGDWDSLWDLQPLTQ